MREDKNLTEGGFSIDLSISRDAQMLDVPKRELNIRMVRQNYEY